MLIVTPQIDWRRDGLPSSSNLLGEGGGCESSRGRKERGTSWSVSVGKYPYFVLTFFKLV